MTVQRIRRTRNSDPAGAGWPRFWWIFVRGSHFFLFLTFLGTYIQNRERGKREGEGGRGHSPSYHGARTAAEVLVLFLRAAHLPERPTCQPPNWRDPKNVKRVFGASEPPRCIRSQRARVHFTTDSVIMKWKKERGVWGGKKSLCSAPAVDEAPHQLQRQQQQQQQARGQSFVSLVSGQAARRRSTSSFRQHENEHWKRICVKVTRRCNEIFLHSFFDENLRISERR